MSPSLLKFGLFVLLSAHAVLCAPQKAPVLTNEPAAAAPPATAVALNLPANGPKSSAIVPPESAKNASTEVVSSDNVNGTTKADAADIANANNKTGTTTGTDTASVLTAIKSETLPVPVPPPDNYTSSNATDFPWRTTRRLAKDVIPIHYDVLLHPNIDAANFTGTVSAIVQLMEPRKFIFLHIKKLNVTSAELLRLDTLEIADNNSTKNAVNVSIAELIVFEKNEFLVLLLSDSTVAGRYAINMHFHGNMKDKITGFYRSTYKNKNNQTRHIATTQFEATDARQAFPCFDEPSFKATFNISVMHPSNMNAVSNMPIVGPTVELGDGVALTKFAKTPPMVTYLVAVIVSDFKYIETKSIKGGIPLRAYASPEQVENGNLQYALDVLKHTVNAYEVIFSNLMTKATKNFWGYLPSTNCLWIAMEQLGRIRATRNSASMDQEYFGIPYQLPKLDMVAIPDFQAGAMENWGLMTFREIYLIYNPSEASVSAKQDVALVVAHEVAHQWFGDLVTTHWWDSLWLNEGFATRIEFVGVTGLDPDWPVPETFVQEHNQRALLADQLGSSHPIVVAGVQNPADITELFDSIPYSKGACVLRMLEEFMGVETFRLGVSRYLRDHSYSTANTDDLWRALNEQLALNCTAPPNGLSNSSGGTNELISVQPLALSKCVDIKQVMDSWTLQMNYPLVTVEGVNATHGRIKQQRFLSDASAATNQSSLYISSYNYTWYIPVTFRALDSDVLHLLWTNSSEVIFDWPVDSKQAELNADSSLLPYIVKFNPTQAGFYRVNYPLSIWTVLADRLTASINSLPDARDRVGLVGDAFELARANVVPYTVPLDFLNYLTQERSLLVWSTVSDALGYVGQRLRAIPDAYGMFRARIRELIKPTLGELGYADVGTTQQRRLRSLLLSLACNNGDAGCIHFAQQMFKDFLYGGKAVSPNLRAIVYTYGMVHNNDEQVWQMMLNRLLASRTPQETRLLLSALASSSEPWQIQHFLQLSFNNSYVRIHDQVNVFSRMASNPVATMYAWNYYRTHIPQLVQRLTLNDRGLGRIPLFFAGNFNDQLQLDEMKAIFEKYPEAGAGRLARRQAVETLESNISWLAKNNATVVAWLHRQPATAMAGAAPLATSAVSV